MMKRHIAILASLALCLSCSQKPFEEGTFPENAGPIYPDFSDVTIPDNIAPLNFCYTEPGLKDAVTTFSCDGRSVTIKGASVEWNIGRWHKFLEYASGKDIEVTSTVLDGSWKIHVSSDKIAYGLNYRLIEPGYEVYSKMGIYERSLSDFDERPLLENTGFSGCVNCHAYNRGETDALSLHIRGDHGATLLLNDGRLEAYNTKTDSTLGFCVYPYWHPTGDYIAYSTNNTRQGFHVQKDKLVEVFDLASDLQVYDIKNNCIITSPELKVEGEWETFPSFSPDGRTLYFCKANAHPIPSEFEQIRYNLYKVSFDPSTGTIGKDISLMIDAESEGRSISFPKPSYDGKYIMYTLSDYGNFSIWHHEADLWLLDLATGERRRIDEVNSQDTESYHNWTADSRWFVFSSRRDDGLFTRLYIAHVDEEGRIGKAFMLPQKSPGTFNKEFFMSYNVPEFVNGPVKFDRVKARKKITSPDRIPFGFRWSD